MEVSRVDMISKEEFVVSVENDSDDEFFCFSIPLLQLQCSAGSGLILE